MSNPATALPLERAFLDALEGTRVAGRYVVQRILGAGGMGLVAAGYYPELGQRVALKFLRPELAADPTIAARFLREARVAAKVQGEHFVRVHDVGVLDGHTPYLVMEMLSGRDLGDELAARGPLPVEEAIDLILQAAGGVAELHALRIVHRDLKPSNLFLASAGGRLVLKVLDFGISKESAGDTPSPLTSTNHLLGTPQYMSPEQVMASRDVDARSDVWSLGAILYEMLSGRLPFLSEEGSAGEIFAKVLYVEPTPLRDLRPDLPSGLEDVIAQCLTKERDARMPSVADLAEALRPFAAPTSLPRIDAVRAALEQVHDSEEDAVSAMLVTPPSSRIGVRSSSQSLASAALARTTPANAAVVRAIQERATPAGVARPSGSDAESAPAVHTRSRMPLVAGGLLAMTAIAAAIAWVAADRAPSPTEATAAATGLVATTDVVATPADATTTVGTSVDAPARPAASALLAPAPPVIPPALEASTARPEPPRGAPPRPVKTRTTTRPHVAPAPAPAASSPASATAGGSLIFDRK